MGIKLLFMRSFLFLSHSAVVPIPSEIPYQPFEDKKIWKEFNSEALNDYSKKFSHEKFITKFNFSINKAWESFQKN